MNSVQPDRGILSTDEKRIFLLQRIFRAAEESATSKSATAFQHEIKRLKTEYNKLILSMPATPAQDPIDVLPGEIFLDCIQLALPLPEEGYTDALLDLTMVSSRWRDLLLSSPTLWAFITFNEYGEDSMAKIALPLHLSRNTMISRTVCLPMKYSWKRASSFIVPHAPRIHQIRLTGASLVPEFLRTHSGVDIYFLALVEILDALGELPSITSIDLATNYTMPPHPPVAISGGLTPLQPIRFKFPPSIQFLRRWTLQMPFLGDTNPSLYGLRELQTETAADLLSPILHKFSLLEHLSIVKTSRVFRDEYMPTYVTSRERYELPHITSFLYTQSPSNTLVTLLPQIAHNLQRMVITIPYGMMAFIAQVLSTMSRLQILSITISSRIGTLNEMVTLPDTVVVTSLRCLAVSHTDWMYHEELPYSSAASRQMCEEFFSTLAGLFPNVAESRVTLGGIIDWTLVHPLLHNRRYLKNLVILAGAVPPGKGVILPVLEELYVDHTDVLGLIQAPELLRLGVSQGDYVGLTRFMAASSGIRTLALIGSILNSLDLPEIEDANFRPRVLSHICDLKIGYGFTKAASPPLFHFDMPALKIISITVHATFNQVISSLLLFILCRPEMFPKLQEIHFSSCLEWDLLFLMLEARNFCPSPHISRISKIELSFVPFHLRSPLARLLRGEFVRRPPNEDLSIEAIREIIFDEKVPGCFTCVQGMLGTCRQPELQPRTFPEARSGNFEDDLWVEEMFWPNLPKTPLRPTMHLATSGWIRTRAERIDLWLASARKWREGKYRRRVRCSRHLEPGSFIPQSEAQGMVTITEFDH